MSTLSFRTGVSASSHVTKNEGVLRIADSIDYTLYNHSAPLLFFYVLTAPYDFVFGENSDFR